ncbi:hypothetical protein D3C86_1749590 [compost metagenome]
MPIRHLTIKKFADESGYTEDAVRTKIRDGIWSEGTIWVKAPDGRVLINTEGYDAWASSTMAFGQLPTRPSKSTSIMRTSGAGSASSFSPPPLT